MECNPSGSCWCMKLPYRLEIEGDECLGPIELVNEIKSKYNLTYNNFLYIELHINHLLFLFILIHLNK